MYKSILFVTLTIIYLLTGCAKCVSTEYEDVEVVITDEYHRSSYVTPSKIGKTTVMRTHPAVYKIYVEYDGVEYIISGSDVYHKYNDKVGQSINGKLEIRKYNDGTIKQDIISLE